MMPAPRHRTRRRDMDTWDVATLDVEPSHLRELHSEEESRAIAINLPAGEEMQEHETHEHAYYVVASGRVEVENQGETITAGPGFVAHFNPHDRRELRATGDSRLV